MRSPLAAILLALLAIAPTFAEDKPTWEPVRGTGFKDVPLSLIPIGDSKKDKPAVARDVWTGLVKGMAKDADTQKLLKKLLNCQTVEIAVLPKDVDGKFRPAAPKGKSQVYLGILLNAGEAGEKEFAGSYLGNATHYSFEVPETRKWDEDATVWHAFLLAANEYLHRNKQGYHLHHGLLADPSDLDLIDERIRDRDTRGKYVEAKIKEFLDKYKK